MTPCDYALDPVCISQTYAPAVERHDALVVQLGPDGKPVQPNSRAIDQLGAKIVLLGSDMVIEASPRGMSQACGKDVCVAYVKSCNATRLACRFSIGVQPYPMRSDFHFRPREFMIIAKSEAALEAAETAITIGHPSAKDALGLTQLSEQSSETRMRTVSAWSIDLSKTSLN